jgi:hypothetical protein
VALVRDAPTFGPFTNPHYDITPDPGMPGWFIATPKGVPL